jgi:hypothetical protein
LGALTSNTIFRQAGASSRPLPRIKYRRSFR